MAFVELVKLGIQDKKIDEKYFRDNINDIHDFDIILYDNQFSEDFLREFQEQFDWNCISETQNMSESFIREFKDKICWFWVSGDDMMSEDFIIEMKDYVDWNRISKNQKLSEKFVIKYYDKINFSKLSNNKWFNKKFVSFRFMELAKPFFNNHYINLFMVKRIQRWWKKKLYQPEGLMYEQIKQDFNHKSNNISMV